MAAFVGSIPASIAGTIIYNNWGILLGFVWAVL